MSMKAKLYPIILRSSRINLSVAFDSKSNLAAKHVIQDVKEILHFLIGVRFSSSSTLILQVMLFSF